MGDEQQKKGVFGLKPLDLTVMLVAIGLLVAIAAASYFGSPKQLEKMVAYLYPANGDVPNVWLISLDNPDDAQQVTFSNMGVYDFDVDSRGQYIAYSARNEVNRTRDIYLLDLTTGEAHQVTFCGDEDAECYTPVFHPQDFVIAYTNVGGDSPSDDSDSHIPHSDGSYTQVVHDDSETDEAHNESDTHAAYDDADTHTADDGDHTVDADRDAAAIENVDTDTARIWVLDLVSGENRPLAEDSQLSGHSPLWSDDGNTIAYYSADLENPGVMVYTFNPQVSETQTLNFVPSYNGLVGSLSPSGQRLLVPDIVNRGGQIFTYLKLVDFTETPATSNNFTNPDDPTDDIAVEWHPDGQRVTVGRRYTDERWTRGYQLYEIDADTGVVTTLLFDESYGHYFFAWDDVGDNLLMQRLPLLNADGSINNLLSPEIWVMNYGTSDLTRIAEAAYFPRWVLPQ